MQVKTKFCSVDVEYSDARLNDFYPAAKYDAGWRFIIHQLDGTKINGGNYPSCIEARRVAEQIVEAMESEADNGHWT